jgi:hypothetical protein
MLNNLLNLFTSPLSKIDRDKKFSIVFGEEAIWIRYACYSFALKLGFRKISTSKKEGSLKECFHECYRVL